MKRIILAFLFPVIIVSCQHREKPKINEQQEISKRKVFSNRKKQIENFLFLDFWKDMSYNEYQIIFDSLLNEKIFIIDTTYNFSYKYNTEIIDTFFIINTYSKRNVSNNVRSYLFKVEPIFNEDQLVQISLSAQENDSVDCIPIINLYKSKYGESTIERSKLKKYNSKIDFEKFNNNFIKKSVYHSYISNKHNTRNAIIIITQNYSLFDGSDLKGNSIRFHRLSSLNIDYISKHYYYMKEEEKRILNAKEDQNKDELIKKTKELI